MKIVSDTGPLIGLAKIDKIYLLKSIAEEVLIPNVAKVTGMKIYHHRYKG